VPALFIYPAQISFLPSDARFFAFGLHQTRAVSQFPQEFFLQIVDGVVKHAGRGILEPFVPYPTKAVIGLSEDVCGSSWHFFSAQNWCGNGKVWKSEILRAVSSKNLP